MSKKPFVGLTPYQIGLPPAGYGFLYLDFKMLENMTHQEALKKLEEMGDKPSLRYKETAISLEVCALLEVRKMEDATSPDNPFEDIVENFYIFGNAIRSPFGLSKGYYDRFGIDPDYQDPELQELEPTPMTA